MSEADMRIVLSPLFLHRHYCKHCVRIFYKGNPDKWIWEHELGPMPPLGTLDANRGFVPDFPVLLMFDEFIIGSEAYERIRQPNSPGWLREWVQVVEVLQAEGALAIEDLHQAAKRVANTRAAMLRRDMRNPTAWADAMIYHDALMGSAAHAFGDGPPGNKSLKWHFEPDHILGIKGSDGESHILALAPLTEPGDDPSDPHYQLHGQAVAELASQLREVNASLAVSNLLNAAPMLWAPYRRYFERKAVEQGVLHQALDSAEASRLFFSLTFPEFSPTTAKQFSHLRSDKRLRQLREVMLNAAKTGDVLDPKYPQRVIGEVLKTERKVGRVRTISGWISSLLGELPIPGIGIASTVAAEFIAKQIAKRFRRDFNWFYLISDGTGHT